MGSTYVGWCWIVSWAFSLPAVKILLTVKSRGFVYFSVRQINGVCVTGFGAWNLARQGGRKKKFSDLTTLRLGCKQKKDAHYAAKTCVHGCFLLGQFRL